MENNSNQMTPLHSDGNSNLLQQFERIKSIAYPMDKIEIEMTWLSLFPQFERPLSSVSTTGSERGKR
jgi:hypothetical protein